MTKTKGVLKSSAYLESLKNVVQGPVGGQDRHFHNPYDYCCCCRSYWIREKNRPRVNRPYMNFAVAVPLVTR
jgi:hypothetical protein